MYPYQINYSITGTYNAKLKDPNSAEFLAYVNKIEPYVKYF